MGRDASQATQPLSGVTQRTNQRRPTPFSSAERWARAVEKREERNTHTYTEREKGEGGERERYEEAEGRGETDEGQSVTER